MLHVTDVKYVRKKVVWVVFDDGLSGQVDFDGALSGPVFDALDDGVFAKTYVNSESETIAWPNGADLAPEFVHDLLLAQEPSRRQG